MDRSVFALIIIAAMGLVLIAAACSKKLPSAPATPPGTAVTLVKVYHDVTAARRVRISGSVFNRSGYTIYDVRVEMTVAFIDSPYVEYRTDTSTSSIASILNGDTALFTPFEMVGDTFKGASPVYSLLPPGP